MRQIDDYLSTTRPASASVDPEAVYQFDGTASQLNDRTVNNHDLSLITGTLDEVDDADVTGLTGIGFDDGEAHLLQAPASSALRIAKEVGGGGDASCTIEAIYRKRGSGAGAICAMVGDPSLDTDVENLLYFLVDENAGNYASKGEKQTTDLQWAFHPDAKDNQPVYLALTISADGKTQTLYLNGEIADSVTLSNAAQKATSGNNQQLNIGRLDVGVDDFKGVLYSLRITAEEFHPDAVRETWWAITTEEEAEVARPKDVEAAWEDEFEIPYRGGSAARHVGSLGLTASQAIPGSINHEGNRQGPDPEAGWEDAGNTFGEGEAYQKFGPNVYEEPQAVWEDELVHQLTLSPKYTLESFDQWGASHFNSSSGNLLVHHAFFYDARNEPWDQPTQNSFTGYGRDGDHYTNGVKDVGPVVAPWAGESQSGDRSPRKAFPQKSLIVITQGNVGELVIFDLDQFDGNADKLEVWMRFKLGDASNFYMLGRVYYSLQHAEMRNGVLVVSTVYNGIETGNLFVLDFKRDGNQNAVQYISSSNHYRLVSGKNITNRHETGLWTTSLAGPTLPFTSEYLYRVSLWAEGDNKVWIAAAGEDNDPVIYYFEDGIAQWNASVQGDDWGTANLYDYYYRSVYFDRDGWLWCARENRLWRCGFQYKRGQMLQLTPLTGTDNRGKLQRGIYLPTDIYWLTSAREYIYCATSLGIYAVHRGSMDSYLAYSIAGGQGRGRSPTTFSGEKLAGENPRPYKMQGLDIPESAYLFISTRMDGTKKDGTAAEGGITLIRLYDDAALQQATYPDVAEPGAFFNTPYIV